MTSSRKLLVAAGCLGLGAAAIAIGRPVEERPAANVLAAGPRVSVAARWRTKVDTIRKGEPLSVALERAGLAPDEAAQALSVASALDPRRVRAGTTITTKVDPDSGASEIVLQMAIDRVIRFTRSATSWVEREELLPWTTDTVVVGGEVQSTLTAAIASGAGAFPDRQRTELAYALADVLEYRVDLSRDLQKGDSVRVLVERQSAPNGLVRPGNIIAARITVAGKPVETLRFAQGTRTSYFDGDGKAMRAAFLRAPLEFRRISSVFGIRRHPILGTVRRHQGMDYAASRGTPVRALGNGRVIFAGWKGGYGKTIEIRHTNGMVTRYGHLDAINVKSGTSVNISQTIGKVGSTGLSTAPHLHFEVLVNGVHRDPRVALRNVTGEPLAASHRGEFAALKARLFAQLDAPFIRPVVARAGGD
ncbi:MAG: M23 family metallopeptidase [Gemmatimonadaceae bacterium]|nr:M23 family metallopeptidase [Gemmatimonadaceae bacterium]